MSDELPRKLEVSTTIGRCGFALVINMQDKILLSGGQLWKVRNASDEVLAFDLTTGFTLFKEAIPRLNVARFRHSSCVINQKVYAICGKSGNIGPDPYLKSIEVLAMDS